METLRGTVTNCQHTLRVSGGANNTSTTTTYITLFRVNGRAMEFRGGSPSSVSDGDQVAVAGLPSGATLTVLAFRNLNTGEVANAGIVGNLLGAVLLPIIGVLLCTFVLGQFGFWVVLAVIVVLGLLTAHFIYRAVLTIRAEGLVKS